MLRSRGCRDGTLLGGRRFLGSNFVGVADEVCPSCWVFCWGMDVRESSGEFSGFRCSVFRDLMNVANAYLQFDEG